jgi:hypothetical protein
VNLAVSKVIQQCRRYLAFDALAAERRRPIVGRGGRPLFAAYVASLIFVVERVFGDRSHKSYLLMRLAIPHWATNVVWSDTAEGAADCGRGSAEHRRIAMACVLSGGGCGCLRAPRRTIDEARLSCIDNGRA